MRRFALPIALLMSANAHSSDLSSPNAKTSVIFASVEEALATSDAIDLMSVDPRISFRANLDPVDLGAVAKHVRISSIDLAKWKIVSDGIKSLAPGTTNSVIPDVRIGVIFYRKGAPIFSLFAEQPYGPQPWSAASVPAYLNGKKVSISTSALSKILSLGPKH